MAALLKRLAHPQPPVAESDRAPGTDHAHVIRREAHPFLDLMQGHGGAAAEQVRHQGLVLGREVLNHHVGHAAGGGCCGKEPLQGLHTPRAEAPMPIAGKGNRAPAGYPPARWRAHRPSGRASRPRPCADRCSRIPSVPAASGAARRDSQSLRSQRFGRAFGRPRPHDTGVSAGEGQLRSIPLRW